MNFTGLFNRSIELLWQHKFLVLMGALMAMLGGEGIADGVVPRLLAWAYNSLEAGPPLPFIPAEPPLWNDSTRAILIWLIDHGVFGAVLAVGTVLIGVAALLAVVLVLYGGLIAGVGQLERGHEAGFRPAMAQGWRRTWHLLIMASFPAIPITAAAILVVIGWWGFIAATGGIFELGSTLAKPGIALAGVAVTTIVIVPTGLASVFLLLLWPVAARACALDEMRAVEAFRRSWSILRSKPGPVIILLLVQIALRSALGIVLILPRIAASLCVAALPVIWLLSGIEKAFASALWTVWYEGENTLPAGDVSANPVEGATG